MSGSPIQYTSRTYLTILADINADPELKDKPEWFKRMIAGVGDMLSMINNATANQSFLRTAFTRQAVADLCELIDYTLSAQTTSDGTALFHLDPATVAFPVTYTASQLKGQSQGSTVLTSKVYEARSGHTMASTTGTFTASAGTDKLTVATDFLYTGQKFRVSSTVTLPSGLSASTDYYAIYISATEIRVASSVANAFAGTYIDITSTGAGVHTWTLYSFPVTLYQQETKSQSIIGTSDAVTEWQEFALPDALVLEDTLIITVGATVYTKVTSFIDSTAASIHYRLLTRADGEFAVQFGNGVYGVIPPASTIYADYAVGGGVDSNLSSFNKITLYTGGASTINGITNPTVFTGGADEESIESAKKLAPLLLKARDRFVTVEDGEALMLAYGGLSVAKINKNVYGLLTAQALGIASGGGNPSGTLKTAITAYLEARTVLEEVDVTFDDVTLTTVTVTSAVKVRFGYTFAGISSYITLAWKIFFSETQTEILEYYLDDTNSIADVITLINTIFSTAFTESTDGTAITKILDALELFQVHSIGDDYEESDAFGFIQAAVEGIDYLTITLPAFPITVGSAESLTHTGSTFNITEIV